MTDFLVLNADCLEAMAEMPPDSVDAIVSDPPYGLAFMGKGWDHAVPGPEYWAQALRVVKPGGHVAAFGGTRTYHRLTCAIEDSGWEIRDCLQWLYGSGFPKSHNIGKAIDKAAGEGRAVVGVRKKLQSCGANDVYGDGPEKGGEQQITAPVTPEAQQWDGWGTALKPAWEPIILARKPFKGNVAKNVIGHGTGALNIDGCRVGTTEPLGRATGEGAFGLINDDGWKPSLERTEGSALGRWPANLILDPEAGQALDAQTGGASRFFYCAKASKAEREAGLAHREAETVSDGREKAADNAYQRGKTERLNTHPTVKPIELMAYVCRLITPPGGLVLDPFCGSGSTGCAAVKEGFDFLGIELQSEYAQIARDRITHWSKP